MRTLTTLLLALLTLPVAVHSQSLAVNGGALGSESTPGMTNHVWADPPLPDYVFDRWVGATETLADVTAWHTTVVMPTAPASITATYLPSAAWTPISYILNGRPAGDPSAINLVYYFPARPIGLIFLFHGTGGSASGFFRKVEDLTFLRDAVSAGYAVAALDSSDRAAKQWDPNAMASNVDIGNVKVATDFLISLGLLTAETPRFSVGMSDGGGFTPKPAYYLGFDASAIWCAGGSPAALFDLTTVPTTWNLARNDDLYDHTTFLSQATGNLARLAARSVAGEIRENLPSPVYPRRFLRVPGLTATDSQAIYDGLRAAGLLDANGYLLADPATSGADKAIPGVYAAFRSEIEDQLDCCYTSHKFYSDFSRKTLRFFSAAVGSVPATPAFFNEAVDVGGGFSYLPNFGYFKLLPESPGYLFHNDLGFLYFIDANDGKGGIYFYDFATTANARSLGFFYTATDFPFPYLYSFELNAFLYYFPDPSRGTGYYTTAPRVFSQLDTGEVLFR